MNNNNNNNNNPISDREEDKWEDAVGTPHDLISLNSNRNNSTKSPSVLQQQQQQANTAKTNSKSSNEQPADPKHIHHSLSDDILNYEHALAKDSQHYLHLHGYNQQANKYSTSKPMEKRASPLATPTNQFDTFQTLLNQILSDNQASNHLMEHIESLNSSGAQSKAQHLSVNTQMSSLQPKNGLMSPPPTSAAAQSKQTKAEPAVSDLTQIKYLKNNYNIQYYPSDFINFAQQSENLMNGSGANANQSPTSSLSPAHDKNSAAANKKLSDFIVSNNNNNNVNKTSVAPNKSLSSSSSSTSSSSSSSTKSSSHKPVLLNNNNNTTPTGANHANTANITSVDVSGFMSSLANKKSPSPPKSTSSNSNEIQQLLDANTNLKSVKSLTNLYESKFTLASSPNISPPVNANANANNTSNSNLFAAPSSYQQQSSTSAKMNPSSTIDFNSIFNSKGNNQSANGTNNPQLQQQQSLLSCSSTSTSSTSSNHPNIDYNNNNNSHHNHSQFQSRSLGAFQNSLKHVNTNNSANSQEINLSVKNVIKLLENNNNSTNTLQQQVSAPSGSNYALISGNGNTGGSLTSSLSFNKAKRSSSIDNVISSVNNSSAEAPHPYVKSSPSSSRSKTSSTSNANSTPSAYINSSKNYILNDTDLSELLESLNSNKKKPSYENMLNVDLSNNRSRSLQRDNLNGSYLENIKQQQQQQQQMQQRKKQLSESKPTSGLNNFSSAYNSQTSNGNKYNEDNLSLIILNQSLNANNSSSNTLTSPSSHVVPKPPPGNPQRTTNLYPARFGLIFFCFFFLISLG
jgi:hypothetical protein